MEKTQGKSKEMESLRFCLLISYFPGWGLLGGGGDQEEKGNLGTGAGASTHIYTHISSYIPIYIHISPYISIYTQIFPYISISTHAPTHPHSPPRHHPPPRAGHSQLGGLAIHRLNITNEALNGTRGLSEISQPFPGACSLASR